jgi:uncharacterized membrane protein
MTRLMTALAIVAVLAATCVTLTPRQAAAQDNTLGGALLGGAAGAIIGGAATGRAGGAIAGGVIGAAAGAILGSQLEPRPRYGRYYWYKGHCWRKGHDGNYYRTRPRYCDY